MAEPKKQTSLIEDLYNQGLQKATKYAVSNPAVMAAIPVLQSTEIVDALEKTGESARGVGEQFVSESMSDLEKLQQGQIGFGQYVPRVASTGVSTGFGLLGSGSEFLYRAVASKPIENVIDYATEGLFGALGSGLEYLKETAPAQYLMENFPEETETGFRGAATAADVASIVFGRRRANDMALNTNTLVEDFYNAAEPFKKAWGLVKASGIGLGRTLWQTLNPRDLAIFNATGVSRGMRDQASTVATALFAVDKIQRELDALPPRTDLRSLQSKKGTLEYRIAVRDNEKRDRLETRMNELMSLQSYNLDTGAWKYANYMLNYQLAGKPPHPLVAKLIRDESEIVNVDPKSRVEFDSGIWGTADYEINQHAQDSLYRHIVEVHGLGPNVSNIKGNPTIIVEDPYMPGANIRNEMTSGQGQSRTAKNVFLLGEQHDFKGMDKDQARELLRGRSLTEKERGVLEKFGDVDLLGPTRVRDPNKLFSWKEKTDRIEPTDKERELLASANRKLQLEKEPRWDEKSNTLFFQTNINSSSKVHGGMNQWFSLDLNTGKATVVQSDRHDMFGMDPVGGDGLVVVFPPIQYDMRGNSKRNEVIVSTKERKQKREQARQERSQYLEEEFPGVSDPKTAQERLTSARSGEDLLGQRENLETAKVKLQEELRQIRETTGKGIPRNSPKAILLKDINRKIAELNKQLRPGALPGTPAGQTQQVIDLLSRENQILENKFRPRTKEYLQAAGNTAGYGMLTGNILESLAIYPEEEQEGP